MRSSRPPLRLLGLGLLLCAVLAAGALLWPRPAPPVAVVPDAGPVARPGALEVLHGWDDARAVAWRDGDRVALRRLYLPGSTAGRADVALLAAYDARGLVVRGMRMQVAAADVVVDTDDRVVVVVTDRLAGAVAVGRTGRVALPQDGWSRRRVELVRVAGEWRVAEVVAQRSPAARTAATSRSENS